MNSEQKIYQQVLIFNLMTGKALLIVPFFVYWNVCPICEISISQDGVWWGLSLLVSDDWIRKSHSHHNYRL